MEIRNVEDDRRKVKQLYEASKRGNVPTLDELFEKDSLILNKFSLEFVGETLLHTSASLGHLDFTKALLKYKPELANELDSHKRSALHLASAEGHTEIVKTLLEYVTKDVCLTADVDGRIPLHHAAMRGRTEVIQLLVSKWLESIRVKVEREKTVLHLCVLYNHLEALKLLVEYVKDDFEFLNSKDHDGGNTILHLAVMLKQVETTKYLLSTPGVEKNAKNGIGFTALDAIENCSRDLEIQNLIIKGVPNEPVESRGWGKKLIQFLKYKNKKWIGHTADWLEKSRKTLMVVATLITTTTFQSAINPPGGVWQENTTDTEKGYACSNTTTCEAGMAVLAYSYQDDYLNFFVFNTLSFIASLCVIVVLVSGVPLQNKIFLWLLTIGMILTLIFMGRAYLDAIWLVTPNTILKEVTFFANQSLKIMIWCLLIFVGFSTLRFLMWLGYKLYNNVRGLRHLIKGRPGNMPR